MNANSIRSPKRVLPDIGKQAGGAAPHLEYNSQLRAMTSQLLRSKELDRVKLSRLLHDEIGQYLSSAGLQLDILRMDLRDRLPDIGSRASEIQELIAEIVQRMRDLSYELDPGIVERAGLHASLEALVNRSRKKFAGAIQFASNMLVEIPSVTARAMYLIADAAVENAVEHSDGSQIEIICKFSKREQILEVRDNGKGFDVSAARVLRRGWGILFMEQYAHRGRLHLSIGSLPGHGAVVRASRGRRLTAGERPGQWGANGICSSPGR
jgi:two-component system sensor histidine kinase NreB